MKKSDSFYFLIIPLNGPVSRDFLGVFVHELNPSGPLINRFKKFHLKISFCRDICELSDSTQAYTARSQNQKNEYL